MKNADRKDDRYAALYMRYSSSNQREASIDEQRDLIQSRSEFKDYNDNYIEYIDEARSGTKTQGRNRYLQLIKDIQANKVSIVFIHQIDRLGRDTAEIMAFLKLMKEHNVGLNSSDVPNFDENNAIMMYAIKAASAETYSENLAKEVKRGLQYNANHCMATGGKTYGYDVVDKKYVLNAKEAKVVKKAFSMYNNGSSLKDITDFLNQKGCKNKYGKPFIKSTVEYMLKNEKYTGTYIYKRHTSKRADNTRNSHKYNPPDKQIRKANGLPQIISPRLFESVQKKLLHGNSHNNNGNFLLNGFLKCGCCGGELRGRNLNSQNKRNPNKPYYYRKYVCQNKKCGKCKSSVNVNAEALEECVIACIRETVFNNDNIVEQILSSPKLNDKLTSDKEKLASALSELSELEEQKQKYLAEIQRTNNVEAVTLLQAVTQKIKKLNRIANKLTKAIEGIDVQSIVDKAIENFDSYMLDSKIIEPYKRKFLDYYIDSVIVNRDDIHINFVQHRIIE